MILRAFVGGFVLAAGTAFSVCAAAAADLPPGPPPPPPVPPIAYAPPVYNWTGIYFGGHVGAGYAGSSWSDPITGAGSDSFSSWGFLGGAQVGGNIQFNRLVLGVEGDFSWTNIKNKGTDSIGDALSTNVPWTSTVTGRVGAAFDRLLLYGKGGVAFAQDNSSFTNLAGISSSTNLMRTGWTAGAGLEYALDGNWSAKIEYDYLGFGSKALDFGAPLAVTSSSTLNVQEIKAGINFRFGGP